jgi:hypothetical protein
VVGGADGIYSAFSTAGAVLENVQPVSPKSIE